MSENASVAPHACGGTGSGRAVPGLSGGEGGVSLASDHAAPKGCEALGEYDLKAVPTAKKELQEREAAKTAETDLGPSRQGRRGRDHRGNENA
jgi:hypothetical protein